MLGRTRRRRINRELVGGATRPSVPPPTRRPRAKEIQHGVLWSLLALLSVTLIAGIVMSWLPTTQPPFVLLQARSYAAVLVPSENLDLVQAARPRFSVEPGGAQFAGIRFDDSLFVSRFRGTPEGASLDTVVRLVQSLDVTAGCTVRIEHWVDRQIRLKIERSPVIAVADPGRCLMFAELITVNDDNVVVERVIERDSPVDLKFAPLAPLRLRHMPVSELRFETEDAGQLREAILGESLLQSAIIEATLTLPDFRGDEERHTARLGDVVKLGKLEGQIIELLVGDTIRTMYRGTADDPQVAGHELRPNLLEQAAAHDAIRMMLIIMVSLLGLAVGVVGVILK